jgi:serine/threonine protein kinase
VEVLHCVPGRLVLACDEPHKTLRDRLQECQARGLPGIPRTELLGYLRTAAEALHHLHQAQGIQHLDLSPRCLLLDGDKLRVADFGLCQLLWLPAGQAVARLDRRNAAPELFRNQVHPTSDQYSLALIYHELLTGAHARQGKPDDAVDLARLPVEDRAVLGRALDPRPGGRWPDCLELVRALEGGPECRAAPEFRGGKAETMIMTAPAPVRVPPAAVPAEPPACAVADDGLLRTTFTTGLPVAVIRLRLHGFCQQWGGEVLADDESGFAFGMKAPRSLWQRWLSRRSGLDLRVALCAPAGRTVPATEVTAEVVPQGGGKPGREMLRVIGPLLLENPRTFLQVNPKRRAQERLAWHHPLRARCLHPDGTVGEPVECRGKDISLNGIGFYLPRELPTAHVRLDLPQTPQTPAMTVPVRIVRVQGCGDGWYEVGAVLLPPEGAGDGGA